MSSPSFRAPVMETGFAKSYQVLPSASVMADEFDSICAARFRLEQSLTSEQPSFSQLLEIRSGSMSSNEALRTMYADSSVIRLKRTARALASLDNQHDEENFVTSDKLPSIASPLVLTVGTSQTKLQAMPIMAAPVRRRNLLPAPKTSMLPASSPTELRALVEVTHSKRQEQIANRRTHQNLLSASSCRSNQQAKSSFSGLVKAIKNAIAGPMQRLSNLLDQLALA